MDWIMEGRMSGIGKVVSHINVSDAQTQQQSRLQTYFHNIVLLQWQIAFLNDVLFACLYIEYLLTLRLQAELQNFTELISLRLCDSLWNSSAI